MPLYPYRCTQCGHRFEKIQKFGAEPEAVCPRCGGALERPLTAPGLQFKGAGWYVNDYASKGSSSPVADSAPPAKTTGAESKAAPASGESAATASPAPSTAPAATGSSSD